MIYVKIDICISENAAKVQKLRYVYRFQEVFNFIRTQRGRNIFSRPVLVSSTILLLIEYQGV